MEKNNGNPTKRRKTRAVPVPPIMSMSELAKLGGGKVAYIKVMTHDEAKELFPAVEGLPNGIDLRRCRADGTPLVLNAPPGCGSAMRFDELEIATCTDSPPAPTDPYVLQRTPAEKPGFCVWGVAIESRKPHPAASRCMHERLAGAAATLSGPAHATPLRRGVLARGARGSVGGLALGRPLGRCFGDAPVVHLDLARAALQRTDASLLAFDSVQRGRRRLVGRRQAQIGKPGELLERALALPPQVPSTPPGRNRHAQLGLQGGPGPASRGWHRAARRRAEDCRSASLVDHHAGQPGEGSVGYCDIGLEDVGDLLPFTEFQNEISISLS